MAGKLAPPVEPPRRFYDVVSTGQTADGMTVLLDGRPVKTPGGRALAAPGSALADMLAREWDAQATHIDMVAMRATRLAFTAIDFVPEARDGVAAVGAPSSVAAGRSQPRSKPAKKICHSRSTEVAS